ncbi:MAG TPA: tannase/feruloyl esterase family alpha/beta hydrolase [Candidatus Binataceae bacterium]|nr:tannase/feruloyl esterase family alpha/beta hydrolase [Candidatus Binataceae bacterium]
MARINRSENRTRAHAARMLSPAAIALLLVLLSGAWILSPSPAAAAMTCADVPSLTLPNTQIISATEVSTPVNHCNVIGVIDKRVSAQDPDHFTYGIGFELNLPDTWNGRFEMMGGGGTDGSLGNPKGSAGTELSKGWAVADDDGGHEDAPGNSSLGWIDDDASAGGTGHFGVDEQARIDYGYNGIGQTTLISKQIIVDYYGSGPQYSYLWGCSNGGRDGVVASQRFPNYFDGIVAGNPGFDLPRAGVAEAWNEQQLVPLATSLDVTNGQPYVGDTFPSQDLEVASAAILSACDGLDGLVDGIIDNYTACTNARVYAALDEYTCSPSGAHGDTPHGGSCLTAGQVEALKKIYSGPVNSHGRPLYSNWYWDAGIWDPPSAFGAGWGAWNVAFFGPPNVNTAINLTLGAGAIPMIFTTPPVITPVSGVDGQEAFIFGYSFDTDAPKIYATAPGYGQSAMDFMSGLDFMDGQRVDLRPFARRGGKMIIYDSLNDGIFSAADLVNWYNSIHGAHANDRQNFVRMFLIPNMAHCGGGPATNSFSGNLLDAITGWVESGDAPQEIIAANTNVSSPFPSGAPFDPQVAVNFPTGGTRPICVYPEQTRYKGSGATDDAANFVCVMPNGNGHRHHS